MTEKNSFDVVIVGGSNAGLAAGMALGRALKKVLIIDHGKPCNRQTPHSHNFLTNDGKTPAEISAIANLQVSNYSTISFFNGTAVSGNKTENGFNIYMETGEQFSARKLIFATGIKDLLPSIPGLSACWGISVIHCPFCHGYEVRNEKTGILANGNTAFEFSILISNWTNDLTLYTNGKSQLTMEQAAKLESREIKIVESDIEQLEHSKGLLKNIVFKDGTKTALKALYAPCTFEQHCKIPAAFGCEMTDEGYIKIDELYETNIKGIFAVGDNASKMRTIANAVAMGTAAGITISKILIVEDF